MKPALSTRAVHAGREDLADLGLHAAPLDLSTTYPARDSRVEAERLDLFAAGERDEGRPVYGRIGNPTVGRFEQALADLEGCNEAVAFASGMAALSACLLAAVAQGKPHVVAVRPLYGTSDHLLGAGLLGTRVSWATPDDVGQHLTPETGLVLIETPGNPTLEEVDIRALVDAAGGVPVLVDNTFATPALQRPAEHGATLVMHSATKFLGGHGDVMGGVVATSDPTWSVLLRQVRIATGGVLHPLAGYLLLRGLSTLPIRMRASSESAAILADRLAGHPAVARVHYPGRAGSGRAGQGQMSSGGALLSVEVVGDPHAVIAGVRLFTPAVSLGSVDSLISHPASLSHRIMGTDGRAAAGISEKLLRVSVGLEDVEDLWRDLDQALGGGTPAG